MKKLHSIYEYFDMYSKEQINEAIEKLTEEEKEIIKLRYGEDLENPTRTTISTNIRNKFYGCIIPKIKKLLGNPNYSRKNYEKEKKLQEKQQQEENKTIEQVQIETPHKQVFNQNKENNSIEQNEEKTKLEKEDYTKILKLLKTPSFQQMTTILSVKEAVIIALKLGYIDDLYFTTETIANFLQIREEEVIETTKKVLLLYKDNINNFIDEIITEANNNNELKLK